MSSARRSGIRSRTRQPSTGAPRHLRRASFPRAGGGEGNFTPSLLLSAACKEGMEGAEFKRALGKYLGSRLHGELLERKLFV